MENHDGEITMEKKDIGELVLARFGTSKKKYHKHLCTVVRSISQALKESSEFSRFSATQYLDTTISTLTELSKDPNTAEDTIKALLAFLSIVLPRIRIPFLRKKRSEVSKPILEILQRSSAGSVELGLECLGCLIVAGDIENWNEIEMFYEVILGFISDHRSKVRKQCHTCLYDILQSLDGTRMLPPACEGIMRIFERHPLFASESITASTFDGESESTRAFLYIIHCLSNCLPLMTRKNIKSVLNRYKSLLELDQPVVSRDIICSLSELCIHPTSRVSPAVLVDLLESLVNAVHRGNLTADSISMGLTASFLDVGMRKVYSLGRQRCVVKLPDVFTALAEILACQQAGAKFAAADALKSLVHACIDDVLINEGVNQIDFNSDGSKSGETVIERICVIIESLLGQEYNDVLDLAFQAVSAMFDKIGNASLYLLKGTLKSLANIQDRSDEEFAYREQLHMCIGSALGALGPETFLSILPLNLESDDVSESRVWLFPILKQYTVGANLSFFTESILDEVKFAREKSQRLVKEGRIKSLESREPLVYSLWSLFPAFCNYPKDTAQSFKLLKEALCRALSEEPGVLRMICSGLQILIQQNRRILEGNNDLPINESSIPEKRAVALYTPDVANANLNALKSSAREFLSVLSSIFLTGADLKHLLAEIDLLDTMPKNSTDKADLAKKFKEADASKDCAGSLQSTISYFASIADKEDFQWSFKKTMDRLSEVTKEILESEKSKKFSSRKVHSVNELSPKAVRAQLLDLAVSHLPGLDSEAVKLLILSIHPTLKQDTEGLLQKRAYKSLYVILKHCDEFLSKNIDYLLKLLLEVLPSCHFSAKLHRLRCLHILIVHVFKNASEQRGSDIIRSFLTEIIRAVKESNKKTRNIPNDLLVQIGHACGEEEQGGNKENLQQLFNTVAGGLDGETPPMISAAVTGLAQLAYEFSDLVSSAWNFLPSLLLSLDIKNREISKAIFGLLEVLVARSPAEWVQTHLRSVVDGVLRWPDDSRSDFEAKVKLHLEMLVTKCGLDAVKAVMPDEHIKLLKNIDDKLNDRKDDAASMESKSRSSTATTSRQKHRSAKRSLPEDFLDQSEERSALQSSEKRQKRKRLS